MNIYIIISALLFVSAATFPQEIQIFSEQQMKLINDYANLSNAHKEFAKYVGDWEVEAQMWETPDSQPIVSKGVAKMELILSGRFLKTVFNSNWDGIPFEGISVDGYDNAKKHYVSLWMDNFGTGLSIFYGESDDEGKTIFYQGTMFSPIQNKDVKVKSIVHYISPNEILMEMFRYHDDVEFKSMMITYKR
jgi:hypothetical protein